MNKFGKSFIGLALVGTMLSCKEEINEPSPVIPLTVQLKQNTWTLPENGATEVIDLLLNKPATKTGSVTISLQSSDLSQFIVEPTASNGKLTLPIEVGAETISFKVSSIDNGVLDGNKTLAITATQVSEGFVLGGNVSGTLTRTDNESPVTISFAAPSIIIRENASDALQVIVNFSGPAVVNGAIEVNLSNGDFVYGQHYSTNPEAQNGKLLLPVTVGTTQASFEIRPVNDALVNGDRLVQFTLANTPAGFVKGDQSNYAVKITDDELSAKAKGYQIFAGNWRYNRLYEYDQNGNLSKVTWEQYTPSFLGGTYNYEYVAGKLHKMVENANRETYYLWEGDRITKTEQYTNGVMTQYMQYGYDDAGNIGEVAIFNRQPDGEFLMSFLNVYLYFTDGNVYKKMVYVPTPEGAEDFALIRTDTFDHYLDQENPFPMVEILPNVKSQSKLPTSYRTEANGKDILYELSYEFDDDGKPLRRTASFPGGSESATYLYY
jgi:hypothetical protein